MTHCHDITLFHRPPPKDLVCPIDGCVVRDAVRSARCGHTFGLKCVLELLMHSEACPVCAAPLDATMIAPDDDMRQRVVELDVRCPEERCSWVGPLPAVSAHVGSAACAVVRVTCPFCRDRFEDGAPFEAHKPVCTECPAICPRCEADMPRRVFEKHVAACDVVPRRRRTLASLERDDSDAQQQPQQQAAEPAPTSDAPAGGANDEPAVDGACNGSEAAADDAGAAASDATPARSTKARSETPDTASDAKLRSPSPGTAIAQTLGIGLPPGDNTTTSAAASPLAGLSRAASVASAASPGTDRASSTETQPASVPVPVACPFAAMGCDSHHDSDAAMMQPAVLARHLAIMCAAHTQLQQQHDALRKEVAVLAVGAMHNTRFGKGRNAHGDGVSPAKAAAKKPQATKEATPTPKQQQQQQKDATPASKAAPEASAQQPSAKKATPAKAHESGAASPKSARKRRSANSSGMAATHPPIAPLNAWKQPSPADTAADSNAPSPAAPVAGGPLADKTNFAPSSKKTSAAARHAARELLSMKKGAALSYDDIVNVAAKTSRDTSPASESDRAANGTAATAATARPRSKPRVIAPKMPQAAAGPAHASRHGRMSA